MIKFGLIAAFAAVAVMVVRSGPSARHLALRRILAIALLLVAAAAVLQPDSVTWIANRLGVGRGADLVLYVFVVVWLVTWLRTNRMIADLDAKLTTVVRAHALLQSQVEASAEIEPDR